MLTESSLMFNVIGCRIYFCIMMEINKFTGLSTLIDYIKYMKPMNILMC